LANIEGTVYEDRDGDGAFGAGDTPLVGATLALSQNDHEVTRTTTRPDGCYRLPDLASGLYTLRAALPPGYSFGGDARAEVVLLLGASQTAVVDFAVLAHTPTPTRPRPASRIYVPLVIR
jgi:hypothetical protein